MAPQDPSQSDDIASQTEALDSGERDSDRPRQEHFSESTATELEENPAPRRPKKSSYDYSPQEIQSLRQALHESNLWQLSFYFLDYILRAQNALFEQIYTRRDLGRIIASMSILCLILSGFYGLTMGIAQSPLQAISAGIKLPILFMLTAGICIPSLYTFNVLLGQRFRMLQTAALMATTLSTTSILLASLAPIGIFFTLTTDNYAFLLLMHVAIIGLCGVYGVRYLYRGCAYLALRMEQPLSQLLLRVWIGLYAIVGMQLGWRLRPFVGSPDAPFALFRPQSDGNFYIAVWNAIATLLGTR